MLIAPTSIPNEIFTRCVNDLSILNNDWPCLFVVHSNLSRKLQNYNLFEVTIARYKMQHHFLFSKSCQDLTASGKNDNL